MTRLSLHLQIAIALALALLAGLLTAPGSAPFAVFEFLGTLFLNALKLLVVPLIITSLINGLVSVPGAKGAGRMGVYTVGWFAGTSVLAILAGLLITNAIQPGIVNGQPAGSLMGLAQDSQTVLAGIEQRAKGDFSDVLLRLVPSNIFAAAAQGDILGLILFSLLFAFAITRLPEPLAATQRQFWMGAYEVMLSLTRMVMVLAPLGVFGLVAATVARTGWQAVGPLLWFFITVLLGLAAHMFVILPTILLLVARVSPVRHYRVMLPALLTAFSTSSSAATLSVTMDCVQRRAGVSPRVSGFFLPIGANINMDGSALYECVAALFIAQAYGLDLSFGTQFVIFGMALLTSVGVAGIPSASLVGIALILSAIGLPLEGLGLILAVDRILDMCRTAVNVFGDSSGAVTVACLMGEQDVLQKSTPPA
ncbi:MAG: dicarboxylate/amino acid:cation symporter [Pseudomonadota bacterium]